MSVHTLIIETRIDGGDRAFVSVVRMVLFKQNPGEFMPEKILFHDEVEMIPSLPEAYEPLAQSLQDGDLREQDDLTSWLQAVANLFAAVNRWGFVGTPTSFAIAGGKRAFAFYFHDP